MKLLIDKHIALRYNKHNDTSHYDTSQCNITEDSLWMHIPGKSTSP